MGSLLRVTRHDHDLNSRSASTIKMASSMTATLKKEKKDESFFEKIGTIARKKKAKEGVLYSLHIKCFMKFGDVCL